MRVTSTRLAGRYDLGSADFQAAYAFLQRTDLSELPDGEVKITDTVRAFVQSYTTKPLEDCRFETHDKFFDIQFLLKGEEKFCVAKREALKADGAYSEEKDITFYEQPEKYSSLVLEEGDYVVVAPEEAHAPKACVADPAAVRKIVIKVPVPQD